MSCITGEIECVKGCEVCEVRGGEECHKCHHVRNVKFTKSPEGGGKGRLGGKGQKRGGEGGEGRGKGQRGGEQFTNNTTTTTTREGPHMSMEWNPECEWMRGSEGRGREGNEGCNECHHAVMPHATTSQMWEDGARKEGKRGRMGITMDYRLNYRFSTLLHYTATSRYYAIAAIFLKMHYEAHTHTHCYYYYFHYRGYYCL